MDKAQLVQRLLDIDQRVRSWGQRDWTSLFNHLSHSLATEGRSIEDTSALRQRLLSDLLGKGSQATDAEVSLMKLLEEKSSGLSRSQIFLDLLAEKVNGLLQLEQLGVKKEAGVDKVAFKFKNWTLHFRLGKYGNGILAVQVLEENNAPYATLSVNPEVEPAPGTFWLKNWSENEELAAHLVKEGLIELTGRSLQLQYVTALEARLTQKGLTASLNVEAATYDSNETDELMTKQLAERDDYGDSPRGGPGGVYDDYPDNSSDVRPFGRPQHQQELWNRLREWWTSLVKKQKGGEGFWDYKNTPYVAPTQSPGFFMAMPAMKIGRLDPEGKLPTHKTEVISQQEGHHISATFEFTPSGIRIDCTWDENDMPTGVSEAEVLSRVVKYLEERLPEALTKFRRATAEDIDLQNRAITMLIQPES